jgi:uncharacterized protein YgiM (DUF1202 family)
MAGQEKNTMYRQRLYRFVLGQLLIAALLLGSLGQASAVLAAGTVGTVDSDIGLNLRAGPGLTHRVLIVLKDGEALELVGRSQSSQWLEVRLPESKLGGWVYGAYVKTSADLSSLPVTEAAGGATDDRPPAAQAYSLYVTIVDNQATVYLQRYPAGADVVVKLGRAGSTAALTVAHGKTDAKGQAQIMFAMPAKWADGQRVVERSLVLTAATADGKVSHTVAVVYIK